MDELIKSNKKKATVDSIRRQMGIEEESVTKI